MDGPPDHIHKCKCRVCEGTKDCQCRKTETQIVACDQCKTIAEHKVCHCEICRWWQHRLSPDKRIRYEADVYLTNRRDGKPAEAIIAEGKLTIEVVELDPANYAAAQADLTTKDL